jgi:hypothetical protein
MSKFIIEIRDDIDDYEAIYSLLDVISLGRISNSEYNVLLPYRNV